MKRALRLWTIGAFVAGLLMPGVASAEILALVNYESKPEETLKALKITGPQEREEGLAVIDVDPKSDSFNEILMTIPLSPDLMAHHIFYDRTMTKAYITSLGKGKLLLMNMEQYPYRIDEIDVPECQVGEDVIFSEDNKTWYLTCMGSNKVVVGDVATDKITDVVEMPVPYPHGLAVHTGIDRVLVTSTVNAADLGDPGEEVVILRKSDHEILGTHKVSNKPSPSGEAPVELLFVPRSDPPIVYVTNMYGGSLWRGVWNADKEDFDFAEAHNFAAQEVGVPLEMYFNQAVDTMYVTTAKPGHLHIFDISGDPASPKLVKSIATAEGAHHVAFTQDEKYAFVQNSLLNLPGMSDGSITVVDLQKQEAVAVADALSASGYNPNSIVLLPKWNHFAGH
ncbi:MAG: hypothetical protein R3316_07110 [Rhodovibrionaceae bacterium]|nr:hypothetical protein [Rhodovibrionaceae bacterium]